MDAPSKNRTHTGHDETLPTDERPGRVARFFSFPLTWMLIGIVLVFLTYAILVGIGSEMDTTGVVTTALIGGAAGLVFYKLVMRYVARRKTPELAARGFLRESLLGMAFGTGFVTLSYLILVLTGAYQVTWSPQHIVSTVGLAVAVSAGAAIVEELTFRGLIFQAVERLGGRWLALVVTAVLFGGLHLLNPGATVWSGFAIAIEAGLLLGAAFLWRRNLWLVIGLHFAWNTVEGLLGIPVSGHRDPGLFVTTAHGAGIFTGGSFGMEASIVPVLVSLFIAVPMLIASQRRSSNQMPV